MFPQKLAVCVYTLNFSEMTAQNCLPNAHVYKRRPLLGTVILSSASLSPQRTRTFDWFGGICMPPEGNFASSACCSKTVTRCPTRVSASAVASPARLPPTTAICMGRCACEYARRRCIGKRDWKARTTATSPYRSADVVRSVGHGGPVGLCFASARGTAFTIAVFTAMTIERWEYEQASIYSKQQAKKWAQAQPGAPAVRPRRLEKQPARLGYIPCPPLYREQRD
jgi:hypothetical protein